MELLKKDGKLLKMNIIVATLGSELRISKKGRRYFHVCSHRTRTDRNGSVVRISEWTTVIVSKEKAKEVFDNAEVGDLLQLYGRPFSTLSEKMEISNYLALRDFGIVAHKSPIKKSSVEMYKEERDYVTGKI